LTTVDSTENQDDEEELIVEDLYKCDLHLELMVQDAMSAAI
jgi:hypothetical protein